MTTTVDTGQLAFPATEYAERISRVQYSAEKRALDALVITDPKNICYLTGYDAYSYYVPQALVVPVGATPEFLVLRQIDVPAARWTTHLATDQIVGYGDEYVTGTLHPMGLVAELVGASGWGRGRIGVEFDGSSFSPKGMHALEQGLPNAKLVDLDRLVEWVRTVKSDREIQTMREAALLSDHAMRTAFQRIAPGVRESEVAADTHAAMVSGVDGIYGTAPFPLFLASGERTNNPHLRWTDATFRAGQPTMIELGGHRFNYAAGLSRTVFLGEPPPAYRAFEQAVREGLAAASEVLIAGNTAARVEQVWREVIAAHGYAKNSRIGYSIGISFPDTGWVERTVSLAPDDHSVLRPNMTIHLMLAVWLDLIGYSLSETFVVRDGAPEGLSALPRELLVK
ncbi:Xaa-Pro aminopeptidase [Tamaricihabitans halophyticus]|uniref:Xaa-Pro aminopeptidase n=1 Tax=Tamaricihabitans halophyticus TaxID=1262583 RepID=A0A4R2R3G4_9PSEU|nr:Xaa-Pro peptidase family protein [Tamaricihabitans halophyticus]TCP54051.1 Xaa-Pro aminopeptidase [Tamaricihabitans halophyticus]